MSKGTRILISTIIAAVSLLVILAGVALAQVPAAPDIEDSATAIRAASVVTPTTDGYTPKMVTQLGDYTFTYPIVLHYPISDPVTSTVRLTVTVDPYLEFDVEEGTVLLPGNGDGTLLFPGGNVIVWTPVLSYCKPTTLTITAYGTFDQGTLDLGKTTVETLVEWNGNSRNLVTPLLLRSIYLPLVMRNF